VAFGDSLVKGVGSTEGHDFVYQLSQRIGRPIVNLGVAGDTTADGLKRLDRVFTYDPKVVIVLLGGNDFLKRVPEKEMFANLDRIVTAIQAHGAAVLLLGIRGGLFYDEYAGDFKAFARNHGTAFVPNVLDGLLGNTALMSDQVHPNDAGYTKVADKVEPVLRDLLKD
jgi:lysophospholipase L1-like esterase